jgi:hypothetical protein
MLVPFNYLYSDDICSDSNLLLGLIRVEFFIMFLMFVLTLADGLCCAWFIYAILRWCWCSEIGNSSVDWAQLRKFHLEKETELSLRNDEKCRETQQLY